LTVDKGVVSGGGRSITYGQLLGEKLFNLTLPIPSLKPGEGIAKPVSQYKLVGTRVPRFDIPAKVTGTYTYIHNVRVPGMLHARVVRPRGQGEYGSGAKVISLDESSIKHLPGVQVVRRNDFVAVVAAKEYDAIQAAAQLKVTWDVPANLPGNGDLSAAMRAMKTTDVVTPPPVFTPIVTLSGQRGDVSAGFAQAKTIFSHTYKGPYQMHGMIGPTCAIAEIGPNGGTVLCNGNYAFRVQTRVGAIASLFNVDPKTVRVRYYEGSSNFGSSPMDDAAQAAALVSLSLGGKPVRLQFMRWDEHGWDNYGPAQMIDVRAGMDANGRLAAMELHHWAMGANPATQTTEELATGLPVPPATVSGIANDAPTDGRIYGTNFRSISHTYPALKTGSFRSAPLRSPNDPTLLFASEQMIDELAHAANMDPVAFRQLNMGPDQRWLGVLNAVAQAAKWQPKVAGSNLSTDNVVSGRGVALGTHRSSWAANVADIEVNKKTGKITAKHMYAVLDAGLAMNPGLIENQIVGQQTMGVSRALHEEVVFSKSHVTSLDWVTYPLLRFKDHPAVTAIVINRPDQLPSGAGEETLSGVTAAIANAFFDATGVRLYQYPMTPPLVRAALKAAGVA